MCNTLRTKFGLTLGFYYFDSINRDRRQAVYYRIARVWPFLKKTTHRNDHSGHMETPMPGGLYMYTLHVIMASEITVRVKTTTPRSRGRRLLAKFHYTPMAIRGQNES